MEKQHLTERFYDWTDVSWPLFYNNYQNVPVFSKAKFDAYTLFDVHKKPGNRLFKFNPVFLLKANNS